MNLSQNEVELMADVLGCHNNAANGNYGVRTEQPWLFERLDLMANANSIAVCQN